MIDSATIEDYILALPRFEFHEETVVQFTERVRNDFCDSGKKSKKCCML